MRKLAVLILCLLAANCTKVETASNENTQPNANKTPAVSPTVELIALLKPIKTVAKFNTRQQKYLNESLPPKVREVLEKAEKFEVLAEIRGEGEFDGEGMTFEPNRIVKIADESDKKNVLEVFYHDAAREDSPAVCYEPHHAIRATYQGKTVEVEICFSCSRFFVKSEFGDYEGTIVRENRKSEEFFDNLVKSKSIEYK